MTVLDRILKNFDIYHHVIAKDMVEYEYDGGFGLTIVTEDDSTYFYNDIGHTIRSLPSKDLISEEEYRREFGYRLQDIMIRKGINQIELAEKTGLTQPQISGYRTGKSSPSTPKIRQIARALECTPDELSYLLYI